MTFDFSIDGLRFDGFSADFANRAAVAFEAALTTGLQDVTPRQSFELSALVLSGVNFSTPDLLGQSLAAAVLREVQR